ncbi:hypothetical protein BH09BAC1_BH09BAC1_04820 [soil metagenome]
MILFCHLRCGWFGSAHRDTAEMRLSSEALPLTFSAAQAEPRQSDGEINYLKSP